MTDSYHRRAKNIYTIMHGTEPPLVNQYIPASGLLGRVLDSTPDSERMPEVTTHQVKQGDPWLPKNIRPGYKVRGIRREGDTVITGWVTTTAKADKPLETSVALAAPDMKLSVRGTAAKAMRHASELAGVLTAIGKDPQPVIDAVKQSWGIDDSVSLDSLIATASPQFERPDLRYRIARDRSVFLHTERLLGSSTTIGQKELLYEGYALDINRVVNLLQAISVTALWDYPKFRCILLTGPARLQFSIRKDSLPTKSLAKSGFEITVAPKLDHASSELTRHWIGARRLMAPHKIEEHGYHEIHTFTLAYDSNITPSLPPPDRPWVRDSADLVEFPSDKQVEVVKYTKMKGDRAIRMAIMAELASDTDFLAAALKCSNEEKHFGYTDEIEICRVFTMSNIIPLAMTIMAYVHIPLNTAFHQIMTPLVPEIRFLPWLEPRDPQLCVAGALKHSEVRTQMLTLIRSAYARYTAVRNRLQAVDKGRIMIPRTFADCLTILRKWFQRVSTYWKVHYKQRADASFRKRRQKSPGIVYQFLYRVVTSAEIDWPITGKPSVVVQPNRFHAHLSHATAKILKKRGMPHAEVPNSGSESFHDIAAAHDILLTGAGAVKFKFATMIPHMERVLGQLSNDAVWVLENHFMRIDNNSPEIDDLPEPPDIFKEGIIEVDDWADEADKPPEAFEYPKLPDIPKILPAIPVRRKPAASTGFMGGKGLFGSAPVKVDRATVRDILVIDEARSLGFALPTVEAWFASIGTPLNPRVTMSEWNTFKVFASTYVPPKEKGKGHGSVQEDPDLYE
jgi:hypothetical protein